MSCLCFGSKPEPRKGATRSQEQKPTGRTTTQVQKTEPPPIAPLTAPTAPVASETEKQNELKKDEHHKRTDGAVAATSVPTPGLGIGHHGVAASGAAGAGAGAGGHDAPADAGAGAGAGGADAGGGGGAGAGDGGGD